MPQYFALVPGAFGLECKPLGKHADFNSAAEQSDIKHPDAFWIGDLDDIKNLKESIETETRNY